MTTIKEYKAMIEGATDAGAVGGLLLHRIEKMLSHSPNENGWFKNLSDVELRISRDEAKYIQDSEASRNISDGLIRVIELAESELMAIHLQYGDEENAYQHSNALSEIRKLKGE